MTWRKRRGMNREALSERCAELGMKLSAESFTNIESGRRKADGTRRRVITVDELMVIARALNVPPVLLLVPLEPGAGDVELTPGFMLPVAEAVEWIAGESVAFGDVTDDSLKRESEGGGHRLLEWTETAVPLGFIRAARRELEDYLHTERSLTAAQHALDRARYRLKSEDDPAKREVNELTASLNEKKVEQAAAALEAARERLADVKATFVAEGFPAPKDLWQDLDEEPPGAAMRWGWGFRGGASRLMSPYSIGFFYRTRDTRNKEQE